MFMEDKAKKVSLEMKPSTGKRADGESEKLLAKVVDLEDAALFFCIAVHMRSVPI